MLQPLEERCLVAYILSVFMANYLLLGAGSIFIIVKSHSFSSEIWYYVAQLNCKIKTDLYRDIKFSKR